VNARVSKIEAASSLEARGVASRSCKLSLTYFLLLDLFLLLLIRLLLLGAIALRVVLLEELVELDQRLLQLQILLLQHLLATLEGRLTPLELCAQQKARPGCL